MFHPVVAAWFERKFAAPTPAQVEAWPAIAGGRDALITAPTGSGKTLAAFLFCLDRLVRDAYEGALSDRTQVLYISPLKALSNDVQKNLEQPLAELAVIAETMGLPLPTIRTAVRTGDTSQSDRRAAVKRPPHVLVTTPESLYILLTSESGRRSLEDVRTVIVDEIHAVTPDKRGAHLALSLERLDDLVGATRRPQRVGLSATVRPVEVAARMLVGSSRPMPVIVDVGQRRDLDLAIEVPKDELGAVCTNEQWDELYDRMAELALEHRSTLVFVNTRKLVERVTHNLGARLGEEAVAAHHGSLSRLRRLDAERRLKAGELRVVVATASLELGIDVGTVDLACLIGSPRSIATALQRIGRSGHAVGVIPKGRLFPLTRDQLVECAAIVRAARRGVIDHIAMREAPLDVLSQQIVATCACEDQDEDALFELVRRAAPYADLPREQYDALITMLSEGIATGRGRAGALLHRDAVGRRLSGRRGARLVAITSGGAIPDNAAYDVVQEPEGTKVGTIDEDFAVESMAGDVFLLGNTSWRIRRVEMGKVRVEDARGAAPSIPFWLGEAPARTAELSSEVGALREEVAERSGRGNKLEAVAELSAACALDQRGAELLIDYVAAAKGALGAIPSQKTVVAERFFDEAGGMQVIVHAPFGGRINRAWGLALRKSFCRMFDFELQAAATDDGVLLSLGPQHSFPLETIFELVDPDGLEDILQQAALQAPMFGTRWRWNATRALALVRQRGGKRVPPPIQRMRADDLLVSVFPAQQGCQDNHGVGAHIDPPDHPLVFETLRDCLTEAMDVAGLRDVLTRIRTGELKTIARETAEPSVLSHEILNANPYAFLDDAPLEERRARAVNVRRGLPAEVVERIGGLDAEAIEGVVAEAQPVARDADELHDHLLDSGVFPENEGLAAGWGSLFDDLVAARRAARLVGTKGPVHWVAAERRSIALAAFPGARLVPDVVAPASTVGARACEQEVAIVEIVRARLSVEGPVTSAELSARLGLPESEINIALGTIENEGAALRGRFRRDTSEGAIEWCDRRLLARIHRRTVDRLRVAIEPVTAADLMRFLLAWQCARPESALTGRDGLARVIGQLQGFEVAAGAWESAVLAARVRNYDPAWLDTLCLAGQVMWGRLAPRESAAGAPTRAAPITLLLRSDAPWLLAPQGSLDDTTLSHGARDVLSTLREYGASFAHELVSGSRRMPSEVESALGELVAAGRITGDGFEGLRALLVPASKRAQATSARTRYRTRRTPLIAVGRWALLRRPTEDPAASLDPSNDPVLEALARQYLRRYGVVFRDLLTREPHGAAWRDLLRVYRRMEMRGELRGGRLVGGFVGEQFALPEALEALRAIRREPKKGELIRLSGCDPLNFTGGILPGPRVPATLGHDVFYRDGAPVPEEEGRSIVRRARDAKKLASVALSGAEPLSA